MTDSIEFDDGNCASGFSSRKPLSIDVDESSSSISESVTASESTGHLSAEAAELSEETGYSFSLFRLNYLVVTLVIMLADGLQGKKSSGYGTQSNFCCISQPMALISFIYRDPFICFIRRLWIFSRVIVLSWLYNWSCNSTYYWSHD